MWWFVCTCVWVRVSACVHAPAGVEVDGGCLPQLLPTLSFEVGSLTEPVPSQVSLWMLGLQARTAASSFYMGAGIWTQVFTGDALLTRPSYHSDYLWIGKNVLLEYKGFSVGQLSALNSYFKTNLGGRQVFIFFLGTKGLLGGREVMLGLHFTAPADFPLRSLLWREPKLEIQGYPSDSH